MKRTLLIVVAIVLPAAALTVWATADRDHRSSQTRVSSLSSSASEFTSAAADEATTLMDRMGYDPLSTTEKSTFLGRGQREHTVLVAKKAKDGKWCIVHQDDRGITASCSKSLFEHGPVNVLESFSAGPGGSTLLTYQLVGVADKQVTAVSVVDTDGVTRSAKITDGAVFFELPTNELAEGVRVERVLAYAHGGKLLSTIDLEPPS